MSERITKNVKTTAAVLLFVLALILSSLYFGALISRTSSEDSTLGIGTGNSSGSASGGLVARQLTPAAVAVKEAGKTCSAITVGSDFMNDIYSALSENIAFIFGASCRAERYDGSFDELISSDEYIYIRFHTDLPASVIFAHSLEEPSDASLFDKFEVGEIFEIIIPSSLETAEAYYAFSRSTGGAVYAYIRSESADASGLCMPSDLSEYRDASALSYAEFNGKNENGILPTTLIFPAGMSASKITVSRGCDLLGENSKLQKEIASIFGISADKTGSYYDEETGGIVYMLPEGRFTESRDGIVFTAENNQSGGISLSDLTGGTDDGSLVGCLAAAEYLVKRINDGFPYLLGGDAEPLITSVRKDGDTVIMEYGCFYDNMAISGEKSVCRIEMTSGKLSYFGISPINVTSSSGERSRSISQYWVIDVLTVEIEEKGLVGAFSVIPKYVSDGSISESEEAFLPEYVPVKIN